MTQILNISLTSIDENIGEHRRGAKPVLTVVPRYIIIFLSKI